MITINSYHTRPLIFDMRVFYTVRNLLIVPNDAHTAENSSGKWRHDIRPQNGVQQIAQMLLMTNQ